MIGICFYYLYLYFSGQKFELKYRTDNLRSYPKDIQNIISAQKVQICIQINKENIFSNIEYELFNDYVFYDGSNLTRYNYKNSEDDNFCFNTSFLGNYFSIKCKDNCTDLNGKPYKLSFGVFTRNLKINHDEKNPFKIFGEIGEVFQVSTKTNFYSNYFFTWTPVLYNTTKIFSREPFKEYLNFYIKDINTFIESKNMDDDIIAKINFILSINMDIYKRE